jgi:hypothetical protein
LSIENAALCANRRHEKIKKILSIDLEIQDKVIENDGKEIWAKLKIIIRMLTHGQDNTNYLLEGV